MRSMLRNVDDHGTHYQCLAFICPGCQEWNGTGLHLLPVNNTNHDPSWSWDGNLITPTLTPSILTRSGPEQKNICHSYLTAGVFNYLGDCTHSLANKTAPMIDLPDWVVREGEE